MRRYKSVIVDNFEHNLHLKITQVNRDVWPLVEKNISGPIRRIVWLRVTRVVELAMKDEAMSYFPRQGTRFPLERN